MQAGDVCASVAGRFGVDVEVFERWNPGGWWCAALLLGVWYCVGMEMGKAGGKGGGFEGVFQGGFEMWGCVYRVGKVGAQIGVVWSLGLLEGICMMRSWISSSW